MSMWKSTGWNVLVALILLTIPILSLVSGLITRDKFVELLLTVILIFAVIQQLRISRFQTEISGIDKKPIIDIQPAINPLNMAPLPGYDVFNLSKYPIKIKEVLVDNNPAIPIRNVIPPDRATRIPVSGQNEVVIEVSNFFSEKISLKYRYDINSRDLSLING